MARLFNRVISFNVGGEIYDKDTKAEDILKNYEWTFEYHDDGNVQIFGHHKDNKGRITSMSKLPKIQMGKKPDTGYYVKL